MSADILGEGFCESMQKSLGEQTRTAPQKSAKAGARSGLDGLFVPDSVAVIGATERPGTVGRTVLSNSLKVVFGRTCMPLIPAIRRSSDLRLTKALVTFLSQWI